jgi:phenylpyruvate tautomerase PptA (4-oxalocrotonate tautomerase family)
MPFLDAMIPEGALSPDAERGLISRLTDLLLEYEGVDPTIENARHLAWVFVHRPTVYIAGAVPRSPRYRFVCQVPEGQYNDERRTTVTSEMTRAVADAENGAWSHPEQRVAVFTLEVPDGTWGGGGRVLRLPDIYELVLGYGREHAEQVLAERWRRQAEMTLGALVNGAPVPDIEPSARAVRRPG